MGLVYLLIGDNKIKIKEEVNALINAKKEADIINFDLEDSSAALFLEELQTIPFLYPEKVIILKNPLLITNPSKYDEKLIEAFINYLYHPLDTTTLLIIASDKKEIDKNIFKSLTELTIVKEISIPTDLNLSDYIENSFKNDGFLIDTQVVSELIERTKGNSDRLELEIEKLKLYKYDSKKILNQDVRLMVFKELDDNIFELVNAVLASDKEKVLAIFNDLMILNTQETVILSLLLQKFNELYQTKILTNSGYSKNEIADIFNVKPGRIYYAQKAAEGISLDILKKNINELTDLDYKIKSGQIDKRLGMELFLIK